MLDADSPFRHLPTQLDVRQAMFCDGVRFAIEMLNCSYLRLESCLSRMAAGEPLEDLTPMAFLDAWSVIDSANRLRVLLNTFPRLKKKTPPLQLVMRALQPAEALRNSVQHLPGDIEKHSGSDVPTWGVLHWTSALAASPTVFKMCFLVPGAARTMHELPSMLSPVGREFHAPTDHVVLSAYGSEVDLSATYRSVVSFVPSIEDSLRTAFQSLDEDRNGSDLLIVVESQGEMGPLDGA